MSISYPSVLDSLPRPASSNPLNSPSHSSVHQDLAAAVEALQAKVGVNSSAVVTSLDYLLRNASSVDPGHGHTIAAVSGLQAALDAKAALSHTHVISAITDFPSQSGNSGRFLTTNGATLSWGAVSGMSIGNAVGSGTPGSVLFVDSSGNLAQENANFFYTASTDTLELKGSANGARLILRAHTANAANLVESYNTAAALRAKVTGAGSFSNAQGRTGSEVYGDGASVNNTNCTAVGNAATVTGLNSVAIGSAVTVNESGGNGSIGIGYNLSLSGSGNVVVGNGQTVTGTNTSAMFGTGNTINKGIGAFGASNAISNFGAMGLGNTNTISHIATVAIGTGMTSSRNRELIIGADGSAGMGGWTGGHRIRVVSTASDSNPYDIGMLDFTWPTSTVGSRKARLTLSVNDTSALREGFRIETDGSAAMVGFYGTAAVAKQSVAGSRGGNAALADLLTKLATLGLITDSTTA